MSANVENVGKLYERNLDKLGEVSSALGWKSENEQLMRFSKLVSSFDLGEGPVSINDYGAGFGDLYPFLKEHCKAEVLEYNAYEINEKVMSVCRDRLSMHEGSRFFTSGDIETTADYSIVSGTFNVKLETSKQEWKEYIFNTLEQLHNRSSKGFSFNLLTSYVDWEAEGLFYANPEEFFSYCVSNFSNKVALLHDYPLFEWTISVKK